MIVSGRSLVRRTCDKCGALRDAAPGVFRVVAGRWICSWHDHYMPTEVEEKIPILTFPVKPVRDSRPFAPRDTYEAAEWRLMEYVAENYRYDYVDITNNGSPALTVDTAVISNQDGWPSGGFAGAAWGIVGLYDMIAENRRPLRMIDRAKAIVKEMADYLLTKVVEGPQNSTNTASFYWGAVSRNGPLDTAAQIAGISSSCVGLALLRAYQIHGTQLYLDTARACLWFCRTAQSGGKMATFFSSTDSGGLSRYNSGAWSSLWQITGGVLKSDHRFRAGGFQVLEFYKTWKDLFGDETIGSSDTAGYFSISRAAPLSQCIAEAVYFLDTGAFDNVQSRIIKGFTSEDPFAFFDSYPVSNKLSTGTGSWRYQNGTTQATGTRFLSSSWIMGIRGVRSVEGDSSRVLAAFDYLNGFGANSAFENPAEVSDQYLNTTPNGSYDNTVAPPDVCLVKDAATSSANRIQVNGTAFVDLFGLGALAALYSARRQSQFSAFKSSMTQPMRKTTGGLADGQYVYADEIGKLGAAGQAASLYSATGVFTGVPRQKVVVNAALALQAHRYAPQAFTGRGN